MSFKHLNDRLPPFEEQMLQFQLIEFYHYAKYWYIFIPRDVLYAQL